MNFYKEISVPTKTMIYIIDYLFIVMLLFSIILKLISLLEMESIKNQ